MMNSIPPKTKTGRVKQSVRTLLGGVVLLVGVVAIPYPGPGWLIVFAGLAILARDYPAAQRVLDFAQIRYETWQKWLKRQPAYVQICFWLLTTLVVIMTIWLLNGYGLMNYWFNLDWNWLDSPLVTP